MSLDDIRAREQAATKGPWKFDEEGWLESENREVYEYIVTPESYPPDPMERVVRLVVGREPDAEFIAHARADIPRLLAALDAVQDLMEVLDVQELAVRERYNANAGGVARAVRGAITSALEGGAA